MRVKELFCGIDSGASATKVVLLDRDKNMVAHTIEPSGIDLTGAAEAGLKRALAECRAERTDIGVIVATGYGREAVALCDRTKSELACHAKAAYHYYPQAITVVDIGSQDNKIIYLDSTGKTTNFKMNRKCAAGTGAFIEEIAARLSVPLESMNDLALRGQNQVALGSFCTVFAKTEVLSLIRRGEKLEDMVRAVYGSVVKRITEMGTLDGAVVMTGGVVAHNSAVVLLMEESLGKKIFLPPAPQLAGAYGAALFAMESS